MQSKASLDLHKALGEFFVEILTLFLTVPLVRLEIAAYFFANSPQSHK